MPAEFKATELLALLTEHRAEFIVIGGIAAILHGSPVMTADLDVVYRREPENLDRLTSALATVNARYRDPAGRVIVPDQGKLATLRINLLTTDLGPLDLLFTVGADLTYDDLLGQTETHDIEGFLVKVLNLETIIETKAYADRPKDRYALPFLREILERRRT